MEQRGNAVSISGKRRSGLAATFWATSPQVWPGWCHARHRARLSNICGLRKRRRALIPASPLRWCDKSSIRSLGDKPAGSWFLFHAWRSSEVLLLRVSCVIICRPRPVLALTEGRSRRKRTRVVIERKAARLNYCSVGRHGNALHNKLSITQTGGAGRSGLFSCSFGVNVTYSIFINSRGHIQVCDMRNQEIF